MLQVQELFVKCGFCLATRVIIMWVRANVHILCNACNADVGAHWISGGERVAVGQLIQDRSSANEMQQSTPNALEVINGMK